MNILEAEDMVKGLPDQVLFQYAQNPPPNIPQYLAVSEVQRRQDMRQRFQSQQQGMEPSVKDQILQGGIASAGGMPPEGMPMEGPPMEQGGPPMGPPQGPPQGMPQGMPMSRGGMTRMAGGGLTPGGIVYMQQGGRTPYSYASLTPQNLQRMAGIFTSMGLYPSGGLDARSFDRLPIEKRKQLFDLLGSTQTQSEPDTPRPQLGAYGRIKGLEDVRLLVESGSPQQIKTAYAEALNSGDESTANIISRVATGRGKVNQSEFLEMGRQIRPLYAQEQRDIRQQERAAKEAQALAERQQRADYLLTGQEPPVAPPAPVPDAAPQPPAAGTAPPGTTPGGIVNAETVGAAPAATGSPQVPPAAPSSGSQLLSPTTPPFLQSLIDSLNSPQRSPEVQAAIDLARDAAEKGLPPPVDLSQYVQSAQERQQTARDEARRMAIANALMKLGTGWAAGDPAAGLQSATQAATETLREGRKEAQAEGRMAEQLQLQQAQQQRQAVIDAMKFKQESVNSIASLVSGEEKADRSAKLQVAQLLVSLQSDLNRTNAELRRAGISDEKARGELRRVALQSATSLIESRMKSGELTEEMIQAAGGIGAMTNQLVDELLGATAGGSDSSEEMMVGDYSVRIRNQPQ